MPADIGAVDLHQLTGQNPEAHFNGNSSIDLNGNFLNDTGNGMLLTLVRCRGWTWMSSGTEMRSGSLTERLRARATCGTMDRSAMGTASNGKGVLNMFRIDPGDLGWRGDVAAIKSSGGVLFPWEQGIGSADYPNITKAHQTYRKQSDGLDASLQKTTLPPVTFPGGAHPNPAGRPSNYPLSYDNAVMNPDMVYVSVDVPKYQPANWII